MLHGKTDLKSRDLFFVRVLERLPIRLYKRKKKKKEEEIPNTHSRPYHD
jgi:hypothetical protein